MILRQIYRTLRLLCLVLIATFSFATIVEADNNKEETLTIVDFNTRTLIRSDGSVWSLWDQHYIPNQVVGISNAIKVVANEIIRTADEKNYILRYDKNMGILSPYELPIIGDITKIYRHYLIDEYGQLYEYDKYNLQKTTDIVKEFDVFEIPFKVKDMVFDDYFSPGKEVYLFLSFDGKLWMRNSVSRELTEIGPKDITFTSISRYLLFDNKGTAWKFDISQTFDSDYSLSPIKNDATLIPLENYPDSDVTLTKEGKAVYYTGEKFLPLVTEKNKKIVKISGNNGEYFYLTEDHKLYYKTMDKTRLVSDQVEKYITLNHTLIDLIFQKFDGSLETWPNPYVPNKNEKTSFYYSVNSTPHAIQVPITVYVNNKLIGMPRGAWLFNNTTYVPLRSIFTNLGATVEWDNVNKVASLTSVHNGELKKILVDYKNQEVFVNNTPVSFDQELMITVGTANLPLRLISEHLGAKVTWNEHKKEIHISLEL